MTNEINEIIDINTHILELKSRGMPPGFFIVRSLGQKLDRTGFLADVPNQRNRGR